MENLVVKYKSLRGEETKISVPYSKIRPSPSPVGLRTYQLMEKVEALNESGWCVEVVDDTDEESPLAAEEPTASTRIRVTVRPALRDIKVSGSGQNLRATRSSSVAMQNPPPASSNGGNVAAAGKKSVIESETPLAETAAMCLSSQKDGRTRIRVPISEIRPSLSSPVGLTTYKFMNKVEALTEFGWCEGYVTELLSGNRYEVLSVGLRRVFNYSELRPCVEWKDGAWQTEEFLLREAAAAQAAEADKALSEESTRLKAENTIALNILINAVCELGRDIERLKKRRKCTEDIEDVSEKVQRLSKEEELQMVIWEIFGPEDTSDAVPNSGS
ncbi:unnamed protein product [Arabis nemorensis]|uniref:Agenet domain-containing protein n=1 Tax=Arabis nemorensis TaxID=586526 RepID=A0A565BZ46_9BRAS|nr:unnamed protein product [Arabis nemorensis]